MHWFFLNTVGISSLGCIAFVGVRVDKFSSSASIAGIMFATKKLLSGHHIPSLDYGWSHHGALASFDMASVRRGFQVYRQVCASCHSIKEISFRNLVGNTHDEAGAKAVAESYEVEDGPNDTGEMFERPGKLSDRIPGPYKNEEQARAANGGGYPPDLSLMAKARHGGADYIFALLTGYMDPPEGKVILPEYEDGTPATETQMAKDVATFLAWTAEPEHDRRKLAGIQWMIGILACLAITGFYKRFRWSIYKTRKISYTASPKSYKSG
eukprot:GSChrysophyteH1.ASY1.ANO1.2923.1 assembled CDS